MSATSASPAPHRWLVLAIVSVALLLIVVDMTVLYTALPRLTHDLGASASAKLWIVNAYPLVVSGLLLGTGTLGDRVGHKNLFIAGLVVFGLASLGAAYSPTAQALIGARAVLAVGAAMMMPATLSIIRLTFEDESERAVAIGIWAAVASGGAAVGPLAGGLLLEYFWWGSVFLINVPIALIALPIAWRYIPAGVRDRTRAWDLTGSLQAMVGLIGIAYAIKEAGKRVPAWDEALLACAIGIVFLAWFARRQRRRPDPLVDFSLFRDRTFSGAVAAAVVAAAALVGMQLVFTQRLQLVLSMTPLQTGLFLAPLPLAAFVSGPLTGRVLARLGNARVLWGSLLMSGLGGGACVVLYQAAPAVQAVALAVLGFGIGAVITAASSTIMQRAPAERAGMAASIEEVSYELGGAIGIAMMGSLLSAIYAASLQPPADGLPAMIYDSLDEALWVAQSQAPELARALETQARHAFDQAFVGVMAAAAALLLVTGGLVWRATAARRAA